MGARLTERSATALLRAVMHPRPLWFLLLVAPLASLLAGCSGEGAVYPARPPATPGEAIADPTPSRVVLHTTITAAGLRRAIEDGVPKNGDGTFPLMGRLRKFVWTRSPATVRFTQGRIALDLHVDATADMALSSIDIPLDFHIVAEPVITSEYVAKLQSLEVKVESTGRLVKFADTVADVLDKVKKEVEEKLVDFSYDLRPLLGEAFQRVAKPIDLPLGDAKGCASLKILGVEAGPTVLADGLEKDLAMVIAPSITIPCAVSDAPQALPPLANVAMIQPGPFSVTIPIAARYDELEKAMGLAFTNGKLFFSKEYPELYLATPEVYAAKDVIVLKLHLGGPVHKPFDLDLDGDLFMTGHPVVEDNELRVPDLEPTLETSNFLLKLKAAFDGSAIRDQARAALKLDIGERLTSVKEKLSTDLAFGNGQGCVKAAADKIEVSGVHVHGNYLRVYVTVIGRASVYLPCP
jgi:hypothetical protein